MQKKVTFWCNKDHKFGYKNSAEIVCKNSVQIVLQKLHFLCVKKGVVKWCKWTLYVCFLARA